MLDETSLLPFFFHDSIFTSRHLFKAYKATKQGDFVVAKAMAETAVKLDPSFEAFNVLGICFGITDDFENAIACFEKSIAIQPMQNEAAFNRATVLTMQKRGVSNLAGEGPVPAIAIDVLDWASVNLKKEGSNND